MNILLRAEAELIEMAKQLEDNGFVYLGNDEWRDVMTSLKHPISVAYKILKQRVTPKPKILLCSDWMGIRQELNRQLKPYGLTVKTKSNYKKWGDLLQWTVEKVVEPKASEI